MRFINQARSWLAALLLIMLLTGCELTRTDNGSGDITQPVGDPIVAGSSDLLLPPAQDTGSVIRFEPASPELVPGSTTTVDILVDNVVNMNGADVQIGFDPSIIQIDDVVAEVEGVQIQPGNFLSTDFIAENQADNNTGEISYIVIQLPPIPPVTGSGVLATLIVQATNEGVSPLDFTSVQLTNTDIQLIPVIEQDGQINVISTGTEPIIEPTVEPTIQPTTEPTTQPTTEPTTQPTTEPTVEPTTEPTIEPTVEPTIEPTKPPLPQVKVPKDATFGICYWVKHNDSIQSIAKMFRTTPFAINTANDLYPPNHVFQNQVLFVPSRLGKGPNIYRAASDEVTLEWVAEECDVELNHLLQVNDFEPSFDPPKGFPIIIPIPPFPPPSKFRYPVGPLPIVPQGCCAEPPDKYYVERK